MLFETLGISMTTNITTAIVISVAPVASCILEMVVLRERCSLAEKALLGVGIVGVIYVALKTNTGGGENSIFGIIFLILAIISGGFFSVFSRKCSRSFAPMEITYVSAALGAIAFNSANVIRHIARGDILHYFDPYLSLDNMIGFIFLGVISAVAATGINNYCLGRMQASTMSAFGGLSTVVTILIGVFVGGETLYYYHYIGIALIFTRMLGVSYIAISRTKRTLTIPRELTRTLVCQKTAQKNHTLARMRSD
jgi:drug/metabolite transporter (DMT)-like permease